jgi:pyruvate/2-oxoglutarate dehydrogenase complex dihydrolipoamide acyltransferase (E2) component
MARKYSRYKIPRSRRTRFDIYSVGKKRHHISTLLEIDVTESLRKLEEHKKDGSKLSFSAWIIKAISKAIQHHPEVAGYLINNKKLITFHDINIAIVVEKDLGEKKVPFPLLIEKTNEKIMQEIYALIEKGKKQIISKDNIVPDRNSGSSGRFFTLLPGILRRVYWRYILRHPRIAHRKLGNAAIIFLGNIGNINGWFVHKTVHPASFGIGSIIRKSIVIDNEIQVREILNMTVLLDPDVIDGEPMIRFLKDLTQLIESGYRL